MDATTKQAKEMKDAGSTYRAIGDFFGVSANCARGLVAKAEREAHRVPAWTDGLSVRAANALKSAGFDSKDSVREKADGFSPSAYPNFGPKSIDEVRKWLGLPPKDMTAAIERAIRLLEKHGYTVLGPNA